jgi:hypothetical protein
MEARSTYLGFGEGSTQGDIDAAYSSWESMASLNHMGNIGWSLVYAFSLVDAVIYAKRGPSQGASFREKSPPLQVGFLPQGGAYGATLRLMEF